MAKTLWNDKLGPRRRAALAIIVDEAGAPHWFDGASIPGVCKSFDVGGEKAGVWSYTEYEVLYSDDAAFVSFRRDFESGLHFPQRSWAEGYAWLQSQAPHLDRATWEAWMRAKNPNTSARWDEYAAAEAEFSASTNKESSMSEYLIVSRHAGAVEWLRLQGINGPVIAQVSSPEQVRGRVVVGNLPLHLAAECEAVVAIDLPGLLPEQRGKDLSPAEMDTAGATLSRYVVRRG